MPDPFTRFRAWLADAERVPRDRLPEPTAFALGTVGPEGQPAVRMLLLKGVDERGFVFYTNLESRKGRELTATPRAAMCFHWQPLERQVRIEGPVAPVSDAEADAYFASRPRESQLGAWASLQSAPMPNAEELERRLESYRQTWDGVLVPRPPHWSGFRLAPERVEFWTGRPSRLHDRDRYARAGDGWTVERLYP